MQLAKGQTPDTGHAARLARINDLEVIGVVCMVFIAATMSRAVWLLT